MQREAAALDEVGAMLGACGRAMEQGDLVQANALLLDAVAQWEPLQQRVNALGKLVATDKTMYALLESARRLLDEGGWVTAGDLGLDDGPLAEVLLGELAGVLEGAEYSDGVLVSPRATQAPARVPATKAGDDAESSAAAVAAPKPPESGQEAGPRESPKFQPPPGEPVAFSAKRRKKPKPKRERDDGDDDVTPFPGEEPEETDTEVGVPEGWRESTVEVEYPDGD